MQHTPTKAQWATVIDNFLKVYPMALVAGESHLDMSEPLITAEPACGTVNCVGGWYAIATLDVDNDKNLSFSNGAAQMAIDLGFGGFFPKRQLEAWACNNPEIWGNGRGHDMFYSPTAWNGAETLEQIIIHLAGVHDRSPE